MSKAKKVEIKLILQADLPKSDFLYFKNLIETYCAEETFIKSNTQLIKKTINEYITPEYKSKYVILLGKDLAYYIQTQKQSLLLLKIEEIAIIIYRPRHLEVPKFFAIEPLLKSSFPPEKYENYSSLIRVIETTNIDEDDKILSRIKEFICLYYLKHESEFEQPEFEQKMLHQVRCTVLITSKTKFWNLIIANKAEVITEFAPEDKLFALEIDFPQYQKKKVKKKILAFQRQGHNPSFFQFAKGKTTEIISFLAMILLFMTLVTCKNYEKPYIVNPENPEESKFEDLSIRGSVCQNKNFLISFAAMMLFSVFFGKFYRKYLDKRRARLDKQKKA